MIQDKYAILKKLAQQRAKDEVLALVHQKDVDIQKLFFDLKVQLFENEIVIEELKQDKKRVDTLITKYSKMLKEMPVGYIICDTKGIILDANPTAQYILGIQSVEKFIGRPVALSIDFDDRLRFMDWISKVSKHLSNDISINTMQKSLINMRVSILNGDELILIATDITKPHNELKMLNLIKKALDNTNDAIIITDNNIKIIYANSAFTRITGYSHQETIGSNPSIMKSGIYGKDFYEKFWEELNTKGVWKGQLADKTKNGKISVHQTTITAIKLYDKITNYIAIFSNITEQHQMNEKIIELSIYDSLTRLPNRYMFQNRIEELCLSKSSLEDGFTLLFIDLDNFKFINDTFGHSFGDELLLEVSRRLKQSIRKIDFVARIGGDEFVVIIEGTVDTSSIQTVCENIILSLSSDIRLSSGHSVNVGASIGVAVYPFDGRNYEDLIKYADIAMYKAKEDGKNRYCFYNNKMSKESDRFSKIKNILPKAELFGEIYLTYQPLVSAKTLETIGVEVLARWYNVQLGDISPFEFITLSEKSGYIKTLGKWIFQTACSTMKEFYPTHFSELAINISGVQLKEDTFITDIERIVKSTGFLPNNIVLEVTESMLIDDLQLMSHKLNLLKQKGYKIALDDFGTGFSSLSYLQKLPVDIVKIDKSFIDFIDKDKKSLSIVQTIIDLCHCLDKLVVAEGVEREEQSKILQDIGCDILQGYLFAKPLLPKYIKHHMKF